MSVGQFIARIERSDKAFQREMSRSKVRSIRNFYETATSQPPIPGNPCCSSRRRNSGSNRGRTTAAWASSSNRTKTISSSTASIGSPPLLFYERTTSR